jgi:hypothetical protein
MGLFKGRASPVVFFTNQLSGKSSEEIYQAVVGHAFTPLQREHGEFFKYGWVEPLAPHRAPTSHPSIGMSSTCMLRIDSVNVDRAKVKMEFQRMRDTYEQESGRRPDKETAADLKEQAFLMVRATAPVGTKLIEVLLVPGEDRDLVFAQPVPMSLLAIVHEAIVNTFRIDLTPLTLSSEVTAWGVAAETSEKELQGELLEDMARWLNSGEASLPESVEWVEMRGTMKAVAQLDTVSVVADDVEGTTSFRLLEDTDYAITTFGADIGVSGYTANVVFSIPGWAMKKIGLGRPASKDWVEVVEDRAWKLYSLYHVRHELLEQFLLRPRVTEE